MIGAKGLWALCLLPFLLFATLNSAGYRFGASDQAFYAPAILKGMDPARYPRDAELIRSQAKLTLVDDVVGPLARVAGVSLPPLFVILQILALALLTLGAVRIAATLYRTRWAAVALLAALTLRHAITRSGTNTLEGYFHPRQLAFGFGALAVASFLRGGLLATGALVFVATALHPTTGTWFAIWLGVAAFVAEPRWRRPLVAAAIVGVAIIGWAVYAGPLAGRLHQMDAVWLETLATKDYLFPLQWPAAAWLVNLAYIPIIVAIYRRRRDGGLLAPRETALVAGCLSLVVVFAATLPFNAWRIALAVQLQPARIFWMLDFLAVIYVIWAAAEGLKPVPSKVEGTAPSRAEGPRARAVAIVVIVVSVIRGVYIMRVEFPDRRIVQASVTDDDWGRVMAWARASDVRSGWLADPQHAVRYGTSVRVAGERDVYVELVKDGAVGMYERAIALRTRERVAALGDFATLTPDHARDLAQRYDLDYLVCDRTLDLPVAFHSGALTIYRLR